MNVSGMDAAGIFTLFPDDPADRKGKKLHLAAVKAAVLNCKIFLKAGRGAGRKKKGILSP